MKAILYLAFFALTSIGVNAQQISQQEIAESSKATAVKISQELNFDDDKQLYLNRAIYSTAQTKQRFINNFEGTEEEKEKMNQKIENQFEKMLTAKFSTEEIEKIKYMIKHQG